MKTILTLNDISPSAAPDIGGKGQALCKLAASGFTIPQTVFVPTRVYNAFLDLTGLRERIQLELHRKSIADMRWEEIWDASLRIRHLFSTAPMPADLEQSITAALNTCFENRSVAVRSSSVAEDSAATSFAGLHESYLNIRGPAEIFQHIRLVWASLWSDAALLYRQELGLDVHDSRMAVVIQEMIVGVCSGILFSEAPDNPNEMVIESVYGLNQGLVDGLIEPDRWRIDRDTGECRHSPPSGREQLVVMGERGVETIELTADKRRESPLGDTQIKALVETGRQAEQVFGSPQDIEWTITNDTIVVLQSRPITTRSAPDATDKRSWYLSLRKSFNTLEDLRKKIEDRLIPEMIDEGVRLDSIDLGAMDDGALAGEIRLRSETLQRWVDVYWQDFIPYAHGVRLFGTFYNDTMHPDDPYEFVDLLSHGDMLSTHRNQRLAEMAAIVKADSQLEKQMLAGKLPPADSVFAKKLNVFITEFGGMMAPAADSHNDKAFAGHIARLILAMRGREDAAKPGSAVRRQEREAKFLQTFKGDERQQARAYLELARSSYRLRDDDNLHLGRIEAALHRALGEGKRRKAANATVSVELLSVLSDLASDESMSVLNPTVAKSEPSAGDNVRARQLRGQPAGAGVARGKARRISGNADLFEFQSGEILICDAVDPTMTFIVPMAAGIVERRGGMLIHGAIIAREYGIPCVTGVAEVMRYIGTGDTVTVDGYLGIVTVSRKE